MDLRTLFLAQTCALAATAAMLWFTRSEANRDNGLRTWTIAIASQALAYLLLSNARWLPAAFTTVTGNAAGATSVALFFVAIRQFAGLRHDWRPLVAMIAIVTVVAGMTGKHYAGAAVFNGFVYAVFEGMNALALWRTGQPELLRVQRVVASCYIAMAIVLPVRAVLLLVHGTDVDYLSTPVHWQEPIYVFGFVYVVITNLGFVVMCKTRAETEVRQQARTDSLTGLANRRALDEAMANAIAASRRSGRPFAVVMADVDHFKSVNDSFGHAAGDKILADFAARLRGALRAPDSAFRYGGEEFCLLLPDTDVAGAQTLADRARAQVALPADGLMHRLTASFGIAVWQGGDAADELFGRADRALYRAKSSGRDRVEIG